MPSPYRKQLTPWRSTCIKAGSRVSQVPGMKSGQRGWNGQPTGRLYGCGIEPLIVGSLIRASDWTLGIERSRARVYGCLGA